MPRADTIGRQEREARFKTMLQALKQVVPEGILRSTRGEKFLRRMARTLSRKIPCIQHDIESIPFCKQDELNMHMVYIIKDHLIDIPKRIPNSMSEFLFHFAYADKRSYLFGQMLNSPVSWYVIEIAANSLLLVLEQDVQEARKMRASSHAWLGAQREKLATAAPRAA